MLTATSILNECLALHVRHKYMQSHAIQSECWCAPQLLSLARCLYLLMSSIVYHDLVYCIFAELYIISSIYFLLVMTATWLQPSVGSNAPFAESKVFRRSESKLFSRSVS